MTLGNYVWYRLRELDTEAYDYETNLNDLIDEAMDSVSSIQDLRDIAYELNVIIDVYLNEFEGGCEVDFVNADTPIDCVDSWEWDYEKRNHLMVTLVTK